MSSFTIVVLPWPFSPISAIRSPGPDPEIQIIEYPVFSAGVAERHTLENKALSNGPGRRHGVRPGCDLGLYAQELDEIGKEERLIGDVREYGKYILDVVAGSGERARKKLQRTPS